MLSIFSCTLFDIVYLLWWSVCLNLLLVYFFIVLLAAFIFSRKSSLYILDKNLTSVTCFANIPPQFMAHHFLFVTASFEERFVILVKSNLLIISLKLVNFLSEEICQAEDREGFSPMFSSRNLIVVALIFRSWSILS